MAMTPKERIILRIRYSSSEFSWEPPRLAMAGVWFTVRPFSFFSMNEASRVSLTLRAISAMASSHVMSSQSEAPGRRTSGRVTRFGVLDDLFRFGIDDVAQLEHRGALRAQAAFVDGMVGVALQVDQLTVARPNSRATATTCAVAADVRVLFGVHQLPIFLGLRRRTPGVAARKARTPSS